MLCKFAALAALNTDMKSALSIPVEDPDPQVVIAKVQAYHKAETARNCYRAANVLVVFAMLVALLPHSESWIWPVVWSVSILVTLLGVIMILKRSVGNGLITLLFSWLILPAWVAAIPLVRSQAADGFKTVTAKTAAQRIAVGELANPITPSSIDGSIAEAKEWIRNAVINPDAVKYQHWSTAEQGGQLSTVVVFTTDNSRNEPVEERLKFIFNQYEKQPVSVYNQKTGNFLFERPQPKHEETQVQSPDKPPPN
jgi:hypothetical protein